MKGLHIQRKVVLALTAAQWGLYDKKGAELAAFQINAHLMHHVNDGLIKAAVRDRMLEIFSSADIAQFGATDGEVVRVLDSVLDEVYGETSTDESTIPTKADHIEAEIMSVKLFDQLMTTLATITPGCRTVTIAALCLMLDGIIALPTVETSVADQLAVLRKNINSQM